MADVPDRFACGTAPYAGPDGTESSPESQEAAGLVARLAEEMTAGWRQGGCPRAEDFLARYPQVHAHPREAIRLVYEEVCLRQEQGEQVPRSEILGRFPQWRAELEVLLACHDLLRAVPPPTTFPEAGETLGGYRLLALLGRGGHGRVFLACQPALGDRPVVLKLAPLDGEEHLSLARLQHTHIVPLYAVHDFPDRNLRALCMPYLGGVTLDRLLERLADQPPDQRTGQHLVAALDAFRCAGPVSLPAAGPVRNFLARASYVQAVCWVGACLAEALQYAHERGLVHLDLKPSNVLLAADAQPMLLDFHLAREPLRPNRPVPERVGGTPLYASPEQQAAAAAVRAGRPVPAAVDGRSDVYSLGLVLCEALGAGPVAGCGSRIGDSRTNPQSATRNPQPELPSHRLPRGVSVGLGDILRKCLAPDPCERYADAGALAADLRRHLADQPLRGVANRSLAERWRKWRRRRPHVVARAGTFLAVVAGLLAVGLVPQVRNGPRLHEARAALAEAEEQLKGRHYSSAIGTLTRGLALVEETPGGEELRWALDSRLRRARRLELAEKLHDVVDRVRFLYGIDSLNGDGARKLEAACRGLWEERGRLVDSGGEVPDPDVEQGTKTDLLDLAILGSDLRVRLAEGAEKERARQEGLRLLAEAEALFGPSPVLRRERQAYAGAPGLAGAAPGLTPRTAWEHYALGRFLLRSDDLPAAAAAFERALELQPDNFWANFSRGVCAYRLGCFEDALVAFSVCVALAPRSAPCYYNRALAEDALAHPDRALRDYDHALQLDAALAAARLNRGILHYRAGRYDQAAADLQAARDQGADPAVASYNLALVYQARHDPAAARASLQHALRHNPAHREARELLTRLRGGK